MGEGSNPPLWPVSPDDNKDAELSPSATPSSASKRVAGCAKSSVITRHPDRFLPGLDAALMQSRGSAPSLLTMTHSEMSARISVDPAVCFGKPCIKGTRIRVSLILDNLAEGVSETDLLREYPQLHIEDIRAALAFAAAATRERVVDLTPVSR